MNIRLRHLVVRTRKTIEQVDFSDGVTFLHGPVSTGKSTVARLVDYCFGGDLERTPAIQQEFIAADLSVVLGDHDCLIERAADDNSWVRVTWSRGGDLGASVNAPLAATDVALVEQADVYNLSDLVFYLCGVSPIKVRQRSLDPDSPLIRLSIRDVWVYCYLDQLHLDSSFFRLEDPFRGRKSQDAMRFFTGLHSERLSQLEIELAKRIDEQRGKREAVQHIREFMKRFSLGSELDIIAQISQAEQELAESEERRRELDLARLAQTHPTDDLRNMLRDLSTKIDDIRQAIEASEELIVEQESLRAEFITAKVKAERTQQASILLDGVKYQRCPQCGADISGRPHQDTHCGLCGSAQGGEERASPLELEALRRDLNERMDQLADSIARRKLELSRTRRQLTQSQQRKVNLDRQLQEELARYDSAFIESVRGAERDIATLEERMKSLLLLQQMPQAINDLDVEASALQSQIDNLRASLTDERARLQAADRKIDAIAVEFKRVMLSIKFPGVSEEDQVVIDPRNWRPKVVHRGQEWTFWDTGSGGKKTLFNVCYALAIHAVALEHRMPVPSLLIIDSPTKNISEEENPELVRSLYAEIYGLAKRTEDSRGIQFLIIDSDLVAPGDPLTGFLERRMAGEDIAPSLIPYYVGP